MQAAEGIDLVVAYADRGGVDLGRDGGPPNTPTPRLTAPDVPVVVSTVPLPLRNALAELAIAALDDAGARATLAWLERPAAPAPAGVADHLVHLQLAEPGERALSTLYTPHAETIAHHARRALRAAARHRAPAASADEVTSALHRAVALWEEELFFEVHEVLEAVWATAHGDLRQALQGVIQVAVGLHHLAHGNPRGARKLLHDGRARLAGVAETTLAAVDQAGLLADTAPWEDALARGERPDGTPPRLGLRRPAADGRL